MKQNILFIIILLFLATITVFNVVNSCKEQSDLTAINQAFTENKKQIASINQEITGIRKSVDEAMRHIDSLNRSNEKTIKRFSNEISKMDELFKNSSDTLIVNAVIRSWSDRLYGLPGFFQTATPDL